MKKISIFMAIAAAASLASCTAQAPKANLKSDFIYILHITLIYTQSQHSLT